MSDKQEPNAAAPGMGDALIEKWRKRAESFKLGMDYRMAAECDRCADELQAALAAAPVGAGGMGDGDLRSCTICGLTVNISKGHVAPSGHFGMAGRSK